MKKIDENVFLYFNQSGTDTWDFFWTLLTDKFVAIPLFAVLLCVIWYKSSFKTTLYIGVFLVAIVGFTDLSGKVIKNTVKRPRPCSVHSPIQQEVRVVSDGVIDGLTTKNAEKCEKYSFFSSHAAVSMALAVFLGLLLNSVFSWSLFLMVVWAVLVSVSRIYLGFHYPFDILAAWVYGALVAWLAYKLYVYFASKLSPHHWFNALNK